MSREKQIEEMVGELRDVWIVDWEGNPHNLSEKLWDDELENIAIELYNIGYRKQSEWISVEERLPEEGGTYLVVLKEKHEYEKEWNYHVDVASFTFEWDCIFHDWDEGQGIEITHWMPLPEAPKKGGGE